MKMMQIIADQLSANTEQIKEDMLQWLYSLRESIMKKSSVYSQVDLNRELSRKDRLLDSYLDGVISKEDYQRKNDELENKISVIEEDLKRCKEKTEDIKDIDRIIDNIDEEISQYITEEKNLKIDFVLKYLESVVMFPDRVIVNIPVIGSEVIVEKVQFVNRKISCSKTSAPYIFLPNLFPFIHFQYKLSDRKPVSDLKRLFIYFHSFFRNRSFNYMNP